MSFQFKKTTMLKEDPGKVGILFTIESDNESFLKIRGVAKEFVTLLLADKSYEEARQLILDEYKVTPEVLDADLATLKLKLSEINFIEK